MRLHQTFVLLLNPVACQEDIGLSNMTLRYTRTNEVCTVNNASLTNFRIVNFERSPKAILNIHIVCQTGRHYCCVCCKYGKLAFQVPGFSAWKLVSQNFVNLP